MITIFYEIFRWNKMIKDTYANHTNGNVASKMIMGKKEKN